MTLTDYSYRKLDKMTLGLASLFNQIAKLRMLSHRAVMLMLLAQSNKDRHDKYCETLQTTLTDFFDISQYLTSTKLGSDDMAVAARHMIAGNAIQDSDIETVRYFCKESKHLQHVIQHNMPVDKNELADFAEFVATPLLAALSRIVTALETELHKATQLTKQATDSKNEVIARSIDELEKSTRMVLMISLNASIEASRFGQAGDGFKQIVKQIQSLSGHMGQVAAKLKSEVDYHDD